MYLVLYINNKQAIWLATKGTEIKFQYTFDLKSGQDVLFSGLDKFLTTHKLKLKDFSGIMLAIQEASLTQTKVSTAMLNALAWSFGRPIVGEYYFSGKFAAILPKLSKNISQSKKFKLLSVKYQRKPDITISKKKPKFTIKK